MEPWSSSDPFADFFRSIPLTTALRPDLGHQSSCAKAQKRTLPATALDVVLAP